jgi:hypothetical protein
VVTRCPTPFRLPPDHYKDAVVASLRWLLHVTGLSFVSHPLASGHTIAQLASKPFQTTIAFQLQVPPTAPLRKSPQYAALTRHGHRVRSTVPRRRRRPTSSTGHTERRHSSIGLEQRFRYIYMPSPRLHRSKLRRPMRSSHKRGSTMRCCVSDPT